ncbi:MAG TPA: hypothetical protein ENJ19_07370 [Gammaproteobacteria bacterium]|nr:hypothetical protein [Gammaproteobacteria bacterium]
MKQTPEVPPAFVEDDLFDDRNQFLHFMLGVIAVAERVLTTLPDADENIVSPTSGPAKAAHDKTPMLR